MPNTGRFTVADYPSDPVTTLAATCDLTSGSATSASVASGQGSRLPSGRQYITLYDSTDPTIYSVVDVNSRSGDTLSSLVVVDGLSRSWPAGTSIVTGPPARLLNRYLQPEDVGTAAYQSTGAFAAAAHTHSESDVTGLTSDLAGKQPLDADLTAIAALDSSTAGALVTDGSGWIRKTYAQLKTALGLTKSDVGLGNVDNTSDANKPVSTAQAAADSAVASAAASALSAHEADTTAIHGISDTSKLPPAMLKLDYAIVDTNGATLSSPLTGIDASTAAQNAVLAEGVACTFYLPAPASSANKVMFVKDIANWANINPIDIYSAGGALVDSSDYVTLSASGESGVFFCDGTNWWRVARIAPTESLIQYNGSTVPPIDIPFYIKNIVWTGAATGWTRALNLPSAANAGGGSGEPHVIKNNGSGDAIVEPVGVNAVQTVSYIGNDGTLALDLDGQITSGIAAGASGSTFTAALVALPNVGAAGATVARTGAGTDASPWLYTITFNALAGHTDLPDLVVNTNALEKNEIQTVTVTGGPTGGTYKLDLGGNITASIARNAPATGAGSMKTILEALPNVGAGQLTVTRTGSGTLPSPYVYTIRWTGASVKQTNQPALTLNTNALTGGSSPNVAFSTPVEGAAGNPSVTIATTTHGSCETIDGVSGHNTVLAPGEKLRLLSDGSGWLDLT